MDHLLQALLLGALQGATEFLPVSSSGHLKIGGALLGIQEPELLFDIVLHVGSLLAVCIVYYKDILGVIQGLFEGTRDILQGRGVRAALEHEGARLALFVVLATVPTGIIGLTLEKLVAGPLSSVGAVGFILLINSVILWSSRRVAKNAPVPDAEADMEAGGKLWNMSARTAVLIGVIQGIAVLPGLSRSGLTITACLFLAVPREHAARFSFLLSIPAILGALVLKMDLELIRNADPQVLLRYGLGALTAGVVGYLCLIFLLKLLKGARFHHFAWYCAIAGLLAIGWHMNQPPETPQTSLESSP